MGMTNEELALKAKAGDNGALLELWEQNNGLACIFASRRYNRLKANGQTCGVELDDLMQSAFLALVRAVGYYDPEKGFPFNSYWGNCVKIEFNALLGIRTSRIDPLNNCTSLDVPLSSDEDSETLSALIADPTNDFEKTDERIYRAQIKAVLQQELKKLTEDQQRVLQLIFYEGFKKNEAAAIMQTTVRMVDTLEHTAIFSLRRRLKGLIQ